jgi:hypothetical protein
MVDPRESRKFPDDKSTAMVKSAAGGTRAEHDAWVAQHAIFTYGADKTRASVKNRLSSGKELVFSDPAVDPLLGVLKLLEPWGARYRQMPESMFQGGLVSMLADDSGRVMSKEGDFQEGVLNTLAALEEKLRRENQIPGTVPAIVMRPGRVPQKEGIHSMNMEGEARNAPMPLVHKLNAASLFCFWAMVDLLVAQLMLAGVAEWHGRNMQSRPMAWKILREQKGYERPFSVPMKHGDGQYDGFVQRMGMLYEGTASFLTVMGVDEAALNKEFIDAVIYPCEVDAKGRLKLNSQKVVDTTKIVISPEWWLAVDNLMARKKMTVGGCTEFKELCSKLYDFFWYDRPWHQERAVALDGPKAPYLQALTMGKPPAQKGCAHCGAEDHSLKTCGAPGHCATCAKEGTEGRTECDTLRGLRERAGVQNPTGVFYKKQPCNQFVKSGYTSCPRGNACRYAHPPKPSGGNKGGGGGGGGANSPAGGKTAGAHSGGGGKPPGTGSEGTASCFNCGRAGHYKTSCPDLKKA